METSILRRTGAAYPVVIGHTWPKFELIQVLMHGLNFCKYLKDQINGSSTTQQKWKHHFHSYKYMGVLDRRSRAKNSVVGGSIWPKFVIVGYIMQVHITCKIKMGRINSNRDNAERLF